VKVLVTGARGFIGRHVVDGLKRRGDEVLTSDVDTGDARLREWALQADAVVHLAGVNRPDDERDFARVNRDLTARLCGWLRERTAKPLVVFSSSTQAELANPYGVSKLEAENALQGYAEDAGGAVVVLRLSNVFGRGCRPNYNSVVATFCHNVAHGLPCSIDDPEREVAFVYVEDVVAAVLEALDAPPEPGRFERRSVAPQYKRTVGRLLADIESFRESRENLMLPDFADRFLVNLYATYLSYLPVDRLRYALSKREDARGSLAEFVKSEHSGQIFISRTHPGVTRGNHFHHTKTEKFLVLEGEGLIRFRHIESAEVLEYRVKGEDFQVVDIPPGYTHSIENVGAGEMITLFWASEIFDPNRSDTIFEAVKS
jgi:UDP-2-acetamido-2,6-beta-L-arabino-hexul-4-ose reductase